MLSVHLKVLQVLFLHILDFFVPLVAVSLVFVASRITRIAINPQPTDSQEFAL
jgi:hypothetical protein